MASTVASCSSARPARQMVPYLPSLAEIILGLGPGV
jgi:hypothetical protein